MSFIPRTSFVRNVLNELNSSKEWNCEAKSFTSTVFVNSDDHWFKISFINVPASNSAPCSVVGWIKPWMPGIRFVSLPVVIIVPVSTLTTFADIVARLEYISTSPTLNGLLLVSTLHKSITSAPKRWPNWAAPCGSRARLVRRSCSKFFLTVSESTNLKPFDIKYFVILASAIKSFCSLPLKRIIKRGFDFRAIIKRIASRSFLIWPVLTTAWMVTL